MQFSCYTNARLHFSKAIKMQEIELHLLEAIKMQEIELHLHNKGSRKIRLSCYTNKIRSYQITDKWSAQG